MQGENDDTVNGMQEDSNRILVLKLGCFRAKLAQGKEGAKKGGMRPIGWVSTRAEVSATKNVDFMTKKHPNTRESALDLAGEPESDTHR